MVVTPKQRHRPLQETGVSFDLPSTERSIETIVSLLDTGKDASRSTLDWANNYRELGLLPVPLDPRTGNPVVLHRSDAIGNGESIDLEAWFNKPDLGIGLLCGEPSGGLVGIDIDASDLAERLLPHFPKMTTIVKTRRGYHIWLRTEEKLPNLTHIYRGELGIGGDPDGIALDILGERHLMSAPPSPHKPYSFYQGDGSQVLVVKDVYSFLDAMLGQLGLAYAQKPKKKAGQSIDWLNDLSEGTRHESLVDLIRDLLDKGVDGLRTELLALGWNSLCTPPQDEAEVRRQVRYEFMNRRPAIEADDSIDGDEEEDLPFMDWEVEEDLAADRASWALYPWVNQNLVTEVIGKRKGGKSTLTALMIKTLIEGGGEFLGKLPHPRGQTVLWMTEEDKRTFMYLRERAGIADSPFAKNFYSITTRGNGKSWPDLVKATERKAKQINASIIVFDNLSAQAHVQNENDNAEANLKMEPIQALARAGFAVIVLRHDGKGAADINNAGRGASAWEGSADIIMRLRQASKADGDESTDRILEIQGRVELETSVKIRLNTDEDGICRYELLDDESKTGMAKATLLMGLPRDEKHAQTLKAIGDQHPEFSQQLLNDAARELAIEGKLNQKSGPTNGRGRPPKVYWQKT